MSDSPNNEGFDSALSRRIGRKLARKRARNHMLDRMIYTSEPPRLTGAQVVAHLRADGVIGAWANRQDIGDSSDYARQLREAAQNRERS